VVPAPNEAVNEPETSLASPLESGGTLTVNIYGPGYVDIGLMPSVDMAN
jgi:hypothetical protein